MSDEKLKTKSVLPYGQRGQGRKKGGKNQATIEREAAMRGYRERVAKMTDKILNKQLALATGVQMLFKIHTDKKGNRGKPELVTSEFMIQKFLENENDGQYKDEEGNDYYFITTIKPDNFAIRDILDRTYGKPEQTNVLKGDEDNPIAIKIDSDIAQKYDINPSTENNSERQT